MSEDVRNPFEQMRLAHEERVKAQDEVVASEAYQSQLKFIGRMTGDMIHLLNLCLIYSTRASEYSENSVMVRCTDDLAQSVLAAWELVKQGLINPVKREMSSKVPSSTCTLTSKPKLGSRKSRTVSPFLQANVDSSIDVREHLKLHMMHPDDAKQFIDELYDAYRDCCAYVHVSRRQIKERLELVERGGSMGFESPEDLGKIGRLMFCVIPLPERVLQMGGLRNG
jgi:hypothetical protein